MNKEKVVPKKIKKLNYYKNINDTCLNLKQIILEKEKDIDALNKKVEDANKKLEQYKKKCEEQQYELSSVYNSSSWKATKPLRSIRRLFKR